MKKLMAMITLATAMMTGCHWGEKPLTSGIDLANLDTTYQPGTDFYEYATHGWQVRHPLTGEYSRYGSFDVLQENNNEQLRELIDSLVSQKNKKGSVAQKIADLYRSAMDSVRLEGDGLADLYDFLACQYFEYDGIINKEEDVKNWHQKVWPRMLRQGVQGLFNMYIEADQKDSKNNLVYIYQGGLSLGQKDYYVDDDPETQRIREAYVTYISALAQHASFADVDAQQHRSRECRHLQFKAAVFFSQRAVAVNIVGAHNRTGNGQSCGCIYDTTADCSGGVLLLLWC